jgi:hypothetical protein
MSAKYSIGIRVDFLNSRYQGDEFRYYDYNKKYSEGQYGFVISVSDEPTLDENTGLTEYHYTIQVGLGEVVDVPESDLINPNASLSEKVEQRLRQKQENKEFKDTEGRIGGSQKEKRAYKIVSLTELKNIEKDEATAIEQVKKDKVYPKLNVNLEIENGVNSGAAFLKTKMRDAYPTTPINLKRRDAYVGFVNYNINKLNEVDTYQQFLNYINFLGTNMYKTLLSILNPELYDEVIAKNEINREKVKEYMVIKNDLTNKLNEYGAEMSLKYKNENWHSIATDYDKSISDKYADEYIDVQQKLKEYGETYNDEEKEFIKSLIPKYQSYYSLESQLIEGLFGKKFMKFLDKSDPYNKTYELAFQYEALSEIESSIAIDKESNRYLETIEKYSNYIEEAKKLYDLTEMKNYFINTYNSGFSGGDFGRSFFYANNIKTIQQALAYQSRWISAMNNRINNLKNEIEKLKVKYATRENNWKWFTDVKTKAKSTERTELIINTLPPLSFIERTGGYIVTESDINTQFLEDKFGFKVVEFGQSLKDAEAKEHVRHFIGAMSDLGDILNLDILKLNKIGGLSIAFASRGSGKPIATYNRLRKIINITKLRGGGAVAHEYMHYIDNIIPKINRETYNYMDYASIEKQNRYYATTRDVANRNVENAINEIFTYIYKRKMPIGYDITPDDGFIFVNIVKSDANYDIPKSFFGHNEEDYNTIDKYLTLFFKRYYQYENADKLNAKTRAIFGQIVKKFGLESHPFKLKVKSSMFYANSKAMKSTYWIDEWELFARAFETYIFDKLAKANRKNNYLVSGGYFDREEGVYPFGEDRENLFLLYDALIDKIKLEYDLSGFKTWTQERVDEYVVIDEKGEEESGIIIDDESGEVIETVSDYTSFQNKLLILEEMITSSSK